MSREIKFRAWEIETQQWNNDYKILLNGTIKDFDWDDDGYFEFEVPKEEYVIEQYTGLKDKNGKEIYEGDIVRQVGGNLLCPVEFKYGGFVPFTSDMMSFDNDYCEVIGNIHEAPKDFRPEHLKRMGVSISKGGE